MAASRKVLIYGGRGALGGACISYFKGQQWWVGNIDLSPNDEADVNVIVNPNDNWLEQEITVAATVSDALAGSKVDAIICVAGGWAGGSTSSKDFIKSSQMMWQQSVWSSTIASSLAANHLKEGGLLTLPGAKAALEPTPGMVGYGMAKAAVHQLVRSLGDPKGGLPAQSVALALLPITLDTPMNRKWMPKADTSSWTPLSFVAELLSKWASGDDRPPSGSLVQLVTQGGVTQQQVVSCL